MRFILLALLINIGMTGIAQSVNYINYTHNQPASFKSKLIKSIMGIVGRKRQMAKNIKAGRFASEAAPLPQSLRDHFVVEKSEINQRNVWTLKPTSNVSSKTILYIHGGGYISNLTVYDWQLIEELLTNTRSTIVVLDFPLAPASSYADAYSYFDALYDSLLTQTSHRNIIVMGNSAGGGLALGFAQKLRNENRLGPSQLILISPWLDITLSNPDIKDIEANDPSLGIEGLRMAGNLYANGLNTKDYRVSPIYGEFSGLGKISVFMGTHDIFSADARRLNDTMSKAGNPINYFEYPKMFHLWILVPGLKEAQHAFGQIVELINSQD